MMAVANKPAIVFDAAKINIKKLELRLLALKNEINKDSVFTIYFQFMMAYYCHLPPAIDKLTFVERLWLALAYANY